MTHEDSMPPDRWSRINDLMEKILDVPADPPEARVEWLNEACGDDHALRREVESLLPHLERPVSYLNESALAPLAGQMHLSPAELMQDEQVDPFVGQMIGHYVVERRLAYGGMSTVYEARRGEGDFEHRVAIKLLHRSIEPSELLRRFHIERQTLARLIHPNIAALLDAGQTTMGVPYLMLEYVDGVPIDLYCDQKRLGINERLRLFQQVARAIHFAHQNLIVHRDLKPNNILVTPQGTPKLLDFGIAKILEAENGSASYGRTATGQHLLTLDYASPEQILNETVTTATDIYSLGVILYELLIGRSPYALTSRRFDAVQRAIRDREPTRPSTALSRSAPSIEGVFATSLSEISHQRSTTIERLRRQLRGDLDTIVLTTLRKEPERRYSSVLQLVEDIDRQFDGMPIIARKSTFRYRASKFVQRNALSVTATLAVALSLLLGLVATSWQAGVARDQRDAARVAEDLAAHEAQHARIEAQSATEVAELLVEAIQLAAQSPEQVESALQLLDNQLVRVERQYANEPHIRANLLDAIGGVHLQLHDFDGAEQLIQRAAAIRHDTFGPRSLEMARSYDSIGNLRYLQGRYDEAASALESAIDLHRHLPKGVHTDIGLAANNLAVVYRRLGRIDDAERLHQEALAIRRNESDGDTLAIAESLNNLAGISISRGNYEDAQGRLREALEIRRALLGENHLLVAQSLNNLAITLCSSGHAEEAERVFRESIATIERLPGTHREDLARCMTNLAGLLVRRGEINEATQLLERSQSLLIAQLGSDHLHVATSLAVLAELQQARGNHEDAERTWSEVLRIRRVNLAEDHSLIAAARVGLGSALRALGKLEQAEAELRTAQEIYAGSHPEDHPSRAVTSVQLARVLIDMGRNEEAQPLLEEALATLSRRYGADSPEAQEARRELERLRETFEAGE